MLTVFTNRTIDASASPVKRVTRDRSEKMPAVFTDVKRGPGLPPGASSCCAVLTRSPAYFTMTIFLVADLPSASSLRK